MSTANSRVIGGQQTPVRAVGLGNAGFPSLPPHLSVVATACAIDAAVAAAAPGPDGGDDQEEEELTLKKFRCPHTECKEAYFTIDELEQHQWSKRHYACVACTTDFPDVNLLATHVVQVHRQSQELTCPGCGEEFDRAASLIGHVEQNHCPRLFASLLHERREKKVEFKEALRKMNPANEDFGFVAGMDELQLDDNNKYRHQTQVDEHILRSVATASPEQTLQQPDQQDQQVPKFEEPQDFPKLGKGPNDYRSGHNTAESDLLTGDARPKLAIPPVKRFENRWVKGETLFPAAAPAREPTRDELDRFTSPAPSARDVDPNEKVTDPTDPRFNAAVFYHPILEKFTCAHAPKCKSKFANAGALIKHLRSAAHRDAVVFKCPYCLRDYKTMASALAHAENASKICRIRETDQFRGFVDHITGGMLDGLNGKEDRLRDGLPRYIVPKVFRESLPFPSYLRQPEQQQTEERGRGRMAEWKEQVPNPADNVSETKKAEWKEQALDSVDNVKETEKTVKGTSSGTSRAFSWW